MITALISALASLFATTVEAGSLADIDHVVLFMQENRAFDHYFGTMSGVRGFKDPNVKVSEGKPVWYQNVNSTLSNQTDYLLPWYLNYLGGNWTTATQCMVAGDNGYASNHRALNGDLNNMWALGNTPWSWGHFRRDELPVHFAIAEGWTVGDMYQESVIASTNPNRVSWISGSINVPGSPQSPNEGGVYFDNNETPGCEGPNLNCYPLKWETAPEFYQAQGVTWQVYQDVDNFDDNPLAWFQQFQVASNTSELGSRGMSFLGLDKFYDDCAAGTLPQVSYIIGPAELSEHPPFQPRDGAWLQKQITEAVINSPAYKSTVLMISYDETGGFGDHVVPYHSPKGTLGEWLEDPYGDFGEVYSGPGFRLPFYIISPWTRGGNVFVEHADHISQIKFVEQWLLSKGINVTTSQIPSWRREHMSDLVKAFDFENPDYSLPTIPEISAPITDENGNYDGYSVCESTYTVQRPPVPYGIQTEANALFTEQGFKTVRGDLTEGRYLIFEMNGYSLTLMNGAVTGTRAISRHDAPSQRWVAHQVGGNQFTFTSAVNERYLVANGSITSSASSATVFLVSDLGNGRGHALYSDGEYLSLASNGKLAPRKQALGFELYSVTYDN
ncbi:phosphoesterase family-domain-containing protein [Xylariaceae sp. FL0255]|nr:phosphoesterase family-domain-containing protein [Xylariaceae sp. FL0255]